MPDRDGGLFVPISIWFFKMGIGTFDDKGLPVMHKSLPSKFKGTATIVSSTLVFCF